MKSFPISLRYFFPLSLLATSCTLPSVDVMPRYGQMELDGELGVDDQFADLNTAGLEEDKGYIGLRAELDMGVPVVGLSTQSTTHSGPGELTAQLDTEQGTIGIGVPVESELNLGLHTLNVTYDLVPSDLIDVGLGFGVTVVEFDATITERGADTIDADETVPLPIAALRAKVDLGDFEASALLTGVVLDVEEVEVTYVDLDILAQYKLVGFDSRLNGSIGLGYRSTTLDVAYEDGEDMIDLEMALDGPYVALIFSF